MVVDDESVVAVLLEVWVADESPAEFPVVVVVTPVVMAPCVPDSLPAPLPEPGATSVAPPHATNHNIEPNQPRITR